MTGDPAGASSARVGPHIVAGMCIASGVLTYRIFSCYPVFRQDRALLCVGGAWSLK